MKRKSNLSQNEDAALVKKWKVIPPGLEQKLLESLFRNNEISDQDTPNTVRHKYPQFKKFSTKVFGSHFRQTKAKMELSSMF